jgi:hypothetical protein
MKMTITLHLRDPQFDSEVRAIAGLKRELVEVLDKRLPTHTDVPPGPWVGILNAYGIEDDSDPTKPPPRSARHPDNFQEALETVVEMSDGADGWNTDGVLTEKVMTYDGHRYLVTIVDLTSAQAIQ